MERDIIKIDEEKCDGCGMCIPNCHEGALQIIDGKAVLLSDLLCDGLGACVGHCPVGALNIEKREAIPYDEIIVIKDMVSKGKNVVSAHLKHLKDHNEIDFLNQGFEYLKNNEKDIEFDVSEVIASIENNSQKNKSEMNTTSHEHNHHGGACPGSKSMAFSASESLASEKTHQITELTHWPIQLHLIQPASAHFKKCDLLVAADCTAFSYGNFHSDFLKGHKVVIACPKLDSGKEIYIEKITRLVDEAQVNTITVMIMEVPCCGGLLQMVQAGVEQAKHKVPVKSILVGIQGEILQEEWV
jgi:ferredoxin